MQQDRNYRYAPTFSGERRSISVMEQLPSCGDCCENGGGGTSGAGCEEKREEMVLAMAYVLSQTFEKLYAPADALKRGTLFMKLDLPYGGRAW